MKAIVLDTQHKADTVMAYLFEEIKSRGYATLGYLYDLVGLPTVYNDEKIGWMGYPKAGIIKGVDGYLLDLPEPTLLDHNRN